VLSSASARIEATTEVGMLMAGTASTLCYIEQYEGSEGRVGLRLREKGTGRKVAFGGVWEDQAAAFMQFLTAGFTNAGAMPDVVTKDGKEDAVQVSGNVDFDSPEELRLIYDAQLQYLFV
jgi:hypothetical protein